MKTKELHSFKLIASQGGRVIFDERVDAESPREAREKMKEKLGLESLTGIVYSITEIPMDLLREIVARYVAEIVIPAKGGEQLDLPSLIEKSVIQIAGAQIRGLEQRIAALEAGHRTTAGKRAERFDPLSRVAGAETQKEPIAPAEDAAPNIIKFNPATEQAAPETAVTEQLGATIIAAIKGDQNARQGLKEMIPVWGLKVMNDEANSLLEQGHYYQAGKKSAQLTINAVGTATVVAKLAVTTTVIARAAKRPKKPPITGVPRTPASFGWANAAKYKSPTTGEWNYRKIFQDHYKLSDAEMSEIEVHHAVERQTLTKKINNNPYPVSEAEIHSIENLRGIEKGLLDPATGKGLHRCKETIRGHWDDFYDKHIAAGTVPTKQELLDFATKVDDKYGSLFTPPVR